MISLNKDHSIGMYVNFSWLISASIVSFAIIFAYFLLAWVSYKNADLRVHDELLKKSNVAARRLAGELLIGADGSVGPVSKFLEKELNLAQVIVLQEKPQCFFGKSDDTKFCWQRVDSSLAAFRKIPYTKDPYFVKISHSSLPFFESLRISVLLWAMFPVLSVVAIGLILQKMYLKRYLLMPIQSLVSITLETNEPPGHWPIEVKDIAKRLSKTFDERDHFILTQIATGVIHDIKALLHSVLSATELVKEQPENSLKRPQRLENLYRASLLNLPKIKQVIDVTLDGSRDIPIRLNHLDLVQTVQNSILITREFADFKHVNLTFENKGESLMVPHDAVQLERVFINIIKNGIESFESNREKKEASKEVKISIERKNSQYISVSIEDSGPGISGPLFKPLRSRKVQGVGLGLVISKKIIEGHCGVIEVSQSITLGGACFKIVIPRKNHLTRETQHESTIQAASGR